MWFATIGKKRGSEFTTADVADDVTGVCRWNATNVAVASAVTQTKTTRVVVAGYLG